MRVKKFTRSKNGCIGCRRRKKKCDLTKPQCERCQRLKIECQYTHKYWEVQSLTANGTTRTTFIPGDPNKNTEKQASTKPAPKKQTPIVQRKNKPIEIQQENLSITNTDSEFTTKNLNEPIIDPSPDFALDNSETDSLQFLARMMSLSPRISPRDYTIRGEALEEMGITPEGQELMLLNKSYSEEDQNSSKHEQPFMMTNAISELTVTFSMGSPKSSIHYRFSLPKFVSAESAELLLAYFCHRMAPTFSTCRKDSSPLVSTYIPLASHDTMVLEALLAWVCLHFEKNGDDSFVALKQRLLMRAHERLRSLFDENNSTSVEVSLATLLILIAFENKDCCSNWINYLSMAQRVLKQHHSSEASSDFVFLKYNLLYHEVTAPSLLLLDEASEISAADAPGVTNITDTVPEAYMGICRGVYKILGDILHLSKRILKSKGHQHLEEICKEAEIIEQRIDQCQPLDPTEDMISTGSYKYHQIFFSLLKDAARLHLRQCVYFEAPVSIRTTVIVGRMMNSTKQLFGTIMDPALLFPLFILAIDTVSQEVRSWLLSSMRALYDRIGSGNILVAIELLQKVWEQNQGGKVHVHWPQVARANKLFVSLA